MSKSDRDAVLKELAIIQSRNGGLLPPRKVVEFAKNPKTALHKKFNWSIRKAAYEHWLWQARELIQVYVTVLAPNTEPIRAFVSLRMDRVQKGGGGYRVLADVLSDKTMRKQVLTEALDDVERWHAKYKQLSELAPIFEGIARVRRRHVNEAEFLAEAV